MELWHVTPQQHGPARLQRRAFHTTGTDRVFAVQAVSERTLLLHTQKSVQLWDVGGRVFKRLCSIFMTPDTDRFNVTQIAWTAEQCKLFEPTLIKAGLPDPLIALIRNYVFFEF